eukprot:1139788-Pelagomonas_calceolata.AAC.3
MYFNWCIAPWCHQLARETFPNARGPLAGDQTSKSSGMSACKRREGYPARAASVSAWRCTTAASAGPAAPQLFLLPELASLLSLIKGGCQLAA